MRKKSDAPLCALSAAFDVLGGKWKLFVLWELAQRGTLRFSQLHKLIPGVTQKMLTQQLRELEEAGLLNRRVYAEVPPRVEYALTPHGHTLSPLLTALQAWGGQHLAALGHATALHVTCQFEPAGAVAAGVLLDRVLLNK